MKFRNKEIKWNFFTYIPRSVKKQYVLGIILFLLLFSFIPKPLYLFNDYSFEQGQKFAYLFDVFVIIAFAIIYQVGYTIAYYRQEKKYNQKTDKLN